MIAGKIFAIRVRIMLKQRHIDLGRCIMRSEDGIIIIGVFVIGILLFIISSIYLLISRNEAANTLLTVNRLSSIPIAEAGVERAIWYLRVKGWEGSYAENRNIGAKDYGKGEVGAGLYEVIISDADDPTTPNKELRIISKGSMIYAGPSGKILKSFHTVTAIVQVSNQPITAGWVGKTGIFNANPPVAGVSDGRGNAVANTVNVNGRDLIYVLGGSNGTDASNNLNDPRIMYFDLKDTTYGYDANGNPRGRWFESPTKMKDLYGNTKSRGDAASAVVNNKIYVIGGSALGDPPDDARSREIDEYDPVTETWTTKASMPGAKCTATAGAVNGKIYVFGGVDSTYDFSSAANSVYAYDPATNSWDTNITPAPTKRAFLSISPTVVNNKIYIMGGKSTPDDWSSEVEEFDPAGNGGLGFWRTLNPMPTPRNDLCCIAVNGKIYAIGGKKADPGDNNQRTEFFSEYGNLCGCAYCGGIFHSGF